MALFKGRVGYSGKEEAREDRMEEGIMRGDQTQVALDAMLRHVDIHSLRSRSCEESGP